jgi:hypothetical protein
VEYFYNYEPRGREFDNPALAPGWTLPRVARWRSGAKRRTSGAAASNLSGRAKFSGAANDHSWRRAQGEPNSTIRPAEADRLGRLLDPKLVHSGKRIRMVGLKGGPVAQLSAARIVGKAYPILMQDAAIQFETDELKAEIGKE